MENKKVIWPKKSKVLFRSEYDDPGIYDEFGPFWGPDSQYKPWIYGYKKK